MNPFLGFFMSPLPKRYWGTASGVGILVSALLQAALSLVLLMQDYERYAKTVGPALADSAVVEAVDRESERVHAEPAMALAALTPLTFLVDSTSARILAYVLLSAIFRAVGYAADHACGDPILTIIDDVVWGIAHSIKSAVYGVASRLRSFF